MAATEIRQLGMVGLGRMGANLVRRLMRDGHECVVYNRAPAPIEQLASEGATGTHSLDEFVAGIDIDPGVAIGYGRSLSHSLGSLSQRDR